MPSKNKTAAKRRKFQRSRSQRSRSRRRTRAIRGGRALVRFFTRRNNRVVPVPDTSPSVNPLNPWLPPSLPTNADHVIIAARDEVSRGNIDYINGLKKLIEPQTKTMKALTDEYEMLGKRNANPEEPNKRAIYARRRQIREEIGQIKREMIGRSMVEDIEKDIRTRERAYARYRAKNLPPLPRDDDILDADNEMKLLTDAVDDVDLRQGKAAFGAEAVLHVTADDLQRQFDKAMGVSGSPSGSVQSQRSQVDKVIDEVTRGSSRGSRRSPSSP